jgi:translocation and assembly module TamB
LQKSNAASGTIRILRQHCGIMKSRRRIVGRWLLILIAASAVGIVLILVTLPLWLGTALESVGARSGLTFGNYSRDGYGRFVLTDVAYKSAGIRASAKRVTADSPLAWVWERMAEEGGEFRVDDWSITMEPVVNPPPARSENKAASGWVPIRAQVKDLVTRIEPWLTRATLGRGTVQLPDRTISIAGASWHERALIVDGLAFQDRIVQARLSVPAAGDEIDFRASTANDEARIHLTSRGPQLSGSVEWWGEPVTLNATFAPNGWIPTRAEISATNWDVPAERVKLGNVFKSIAGHAHIVWQENSFTVDVGAQSTSLGESEAPPLDVALRGRGNLEAATVEVLQVQMPGARAQLSSPVTIAKSGEIREAPARFTTDIDLAQLPWIDATGTVTGDVEVVARPAGAAAPPVDFKFHARDVAAKGVSLASADLQGRMEWPRIQLAEATLVGVHGEKLRATGGWDLKAKEALDVTVGGQLRQETFARWLPKNVTFNSVVVDASARGPLAQIEHRGTMKVENAVAGPSKPLGIAVEWDGIGPRAGRIAANVSAGESRISFSGAVDKEHARLTALEFAPAREEPLRLAGPATLRWQPALQLEGFELRGPSGDLDANATWGPSGKIAVALRGVRSAWFSEFVTLPEPAWTVSALAVNGSWDNGPMRFEAVADVTAALREKREATAILHLQGDETGVRIRALRAMEGGTPVLTATGTIPAVITPGGKPMFEFKSEGAVALNATTVENAAFWEQLGKVAGVTLTAPRVTANVAGTLRAPKGEIRGQIERVAFAPKEGKRALPAIERIELALAGTRDGIALERLTLNIEGQTVRARGTLPLPEKDWTALRKDPLTYSRRVADLRIDIPKAEIAAFAALLPEAIVPEGTIEADIAFRDGSLAGSLQVHGAATRSLGTLGALHEVTADVKLEGDVVRLHAVSAQLGGEPVRISGTVTLPPLESARGKGPLPMPAFDLKAEARNIPLVRRIGTLVRADLNVGLISPVNGSPVVSGTVRLRNSLFLQDVRGLIPSGTKSKSTRPPYFAVEAEPFSAWRLDVSVVGEEFMRMRTTLFTGAASADFRLGGTLGEPTLIGEATIDRGRVQLPFATFEVQEGRVSITPAQPHEPEIWLTATTRRFEYDLRMEVSGNASSPALMFESTPPLEHGQVLLMVMAGVVPNNAVAVTQQQRATRLGSYLGKSLLSGFGDGNDTNRLTITSGEDISEQGRETYDIEYGFNQRWSLTAGYDEYDTHSIGMKWQALARGGTKLASSASETLDSEGVAPSAVEPADVSPMQGDKASRKPAKIDVSGLGWFADFEMEASLKRLLGDAHRPTLNSHAVEDALFLLLSAVRERGYLRPTVRIQILNADGTRREFATDADLATPVPRDLAARRVQFRVSRGIHYFIEDLEIAGLQAIEGDAARAYFVADPGLFKRRAALTFTPDRLKRGVAGLEAALRERGFADATVKTGEPWIDHDTGAVAVAVEVHEGPRWQIANVTVEGEVAGIDSLAGVVRYAGEPWSESIEQDIAAEVRKNYLQQGYADARVRVSHQIEPAGTSERLVDVVAQIEPGSQVIVGDVRFEGNVRTNESVLRRRVPLGPGDPLNPLSAQRARHRIARLGVFEDVDVRFEPPEGNRRDVVFDVEPGRQLQVNLLGGYNTYEQLRAGVEVRQFNLWGRAHQTRGLLVQSMKSSRGEYSYTVPELFGEEVTGTARLTGLRREEVAFMREEYGLRFTVDTPLRFLDANATLGYSFEVLRNRDNELESRAFDARQVEVASVEAGLTRDRRDNPLLPRDGYRWYGRNETASQLLGGGAEYQRNEFGGTYHRPWGIGRWLHFGAAHGVITTFGSNDEKLPVNKRFFPGGDGSIRGYQVGEAAPRGADGRFVGAKSYLNATAEFEQALTTQWSAVTFVDALGSARTLAKYPFEEVLVAVGLGVRYQTLIGPVRAEYGYNLNRRPGDPRGTFLLSIGFAF